MYSQAIGRQLIDEQLIVYTFSSMHQNKIYKLTQSPSVFPYSAHTAVPP